LTVLKFQTKQIQTAYVIMTKLKRGMIQ